MIKVLYTNTLCNISVIPPRLEDTFWQSLYTFVLLETMKGITRWIGLLSTAICVLTEASWRLHILSVVWERTETTTQAYHVIISFLDVNIKSHCAPLAYYTFVTVCLSLGCLCRNGCHSFESPFFIQLSLYYLAYLSTGRHGEKLMSQFYGLWENCALFATATFNHFSRL